MKQIKDSAVYLTVARDIAAGDFDVNRITGATEGACDVLCCYGLSGSHERLDLRNEFRSLFVDGEGYNLIDDVCKSAREATQVRILALCFAAAIVESEGR